MVRKDDRNVSEILAQRVLLGASRPKESTRTKRQVDASSAESENSVTSDTDLNEVLYDHDQKKTNKYDSNEQLKL